jgi:hypothetical protein
MSLINLPVERWRAVLVALLDIQSSEAKGCTFGICQEVADRIEFRNDAKKVVKAMAVDWRNFSGNEEFPVPSTMKGSDACDQYLKCKNKWDKKTKYGQLRWALLEYLIQRVQSELVHAADMVEALNLLKAMKEDPDNISNIEGGICFNIKSHNHVRGTVKEMMQEWPRASGTWSYPVYTDRETDPESEYDHAKIEGTMWSRDTAYGRERWLLVDYLIMRLEAYCNGG